MLTILLVVLLIILLGGGGGYYAHGRYGAPGLGGVLGLVLVVLVVLWLVGALSGAVGPSPALENVFRHRRGAPRDRASWFGDQRASAPVAGNGSRIREHSQDVRVSKTL